MPVDWRALEDSEFHGVTFVVHARPRAIQGGSNLIHDDAITFIESLWLRAKIHKRRRSPPPLGTLALAITTALQEAEFDLARARTGEGKPRKEARLSRRSRARSATLRGVHLAWAVPRGARRRP